jgi:hypothetical protein
MDSNDKALHHGLRRPLSWSPKAHDEWYAALEGRRVRRAAHNWRVEVVGVHGAGSDYWLQLRLIGRPALERVLRVPSGTSIEAALHMVMEALDVSEGSLIRSTHQAA